MENAKVLQFENGSPRGLTPDDVLRLKAFFPIDQHEFLRSMIYIREEAISNRLDEIDPGWSFEVVAVDWRDPMHCVVTAALTVKGVRRENAGENYGAKKTAENVQKSATTDALKRCARLFGVGRYLLSAGDIKDARALKAWIWGKNYNPSTQLVGDLTTEAAQQPDAQPEPEPPAASDNGDWAWPEGYSADIKIVMQRVQELTDTNGIEHARRIVKKLGRVGQFGPDMDEDAILDVVSSRQRTKSEAAAQITFEDI